MSGDPILLAIDGLPVGGTERQVVELLKGLRRGGRYSVMLAVLDRGGDLESEAVRNAADVLPVRRRARFDCTPALSLMEQGRRAGIRLIYAMGWMSALAALPAARRLRVPIINGTIRSAPPTLGVRDRISRWCAVRSDWIVANSRAALTAYGLGEHPRTQMIANGIDLTRLERVVPAGADEPTICMVANFRAVKDHATVIRAMPQIRSVHPQAQLILVGKDGGTLAGHRQLAQQLGIGAAVRFITDTLRPESFIAASQVCVLTSGHESFSNAILEYMALSKPVVATDTCGDTAALIGDGESGFVVPLGATEALAARIIELLSEPERARRMGESARRRVEKFAVARMVAEYEALFERFVPPGRTAGDR